MKRLLTCLLLMVIGMGSTLISVNADVTPAFVDPTLEPGESALFVKTVDVPAYPPKLDVCLLVDLSGSYSNDLTNIKTQMPFVFDAVKGEIDDVRFCLASFVDFPFENWGYPPSGDYAYRLDQDLTPDKATWMEDVNAMTTKSGNDTPESQYEALHEMALGLGNITVTEGQDPGWRADATKVIIITTDAPFHVAGDGGGPFPYPGPTAIDATQALIDTGIKVIALKAPGSGAEMDALAADTGGSVQPTSGTSDDIADAILAAFEALTFDITGTPDGCDKLDISLDPTAHLDVLGPDTVYFDETILVPADATDIDNPYCCDVVFTAGDAVIGTQEVCATVQREYAIDIKPLSFPNSINLKRTTGVIPVAILGAADFDVTFIDAATLMFGHTCTDQVPAHDLTDGFVYDDHLQDANLDGYMDLVSHYVIGGTGIVSGDTMACISGKTNDGINFVGYDSVLTRH